MDDLEQLETLMINLPPEKKARFKARCSEQRSSMRDVLESFVDRFNENPEILADLK